MVELLERDDLLQALEGYVDAARHGEGSIVFVGAEAGAGKTSLVREAARRLRESAVVVEGACDSLTTPRPLSPLLDFATDPHAGLGELASDMDPGEMFGVVLETLRGRLRPVFMVIEDIHWADEGTLDFLRFIGRRVADTNGAIVCTYRDDEVGPDHPLSVVLGQLAPLDSTYRLTVPMLSLDAVRELAEGRGLDARNLFEVTGGNAFYVTEVIASGLTVPTTVRDAVLSRFGVLDKATRKAVEAVSIAPRAMEPEFVAPLTGASSDQLEAAVVAGVLTTDGHSYRFRHEIARASVEESIHQPRRIELHRKMVSLLSEEDPLDLARISHHAVASESEALIATYAPPAAREAVRRGSNREAAELFAEAVAVGDNVTADQLAEIRCDYGSALRVLGRPGEALVQYQAAEEYYNSVGDLRRLGDVLTWVAGSYWDLSDTETSRKTTDRAIELLEGDGPSEELSRVYQAAAGFWMLARKYAPGMAAGRRALEIAEEVGSREMVLSARQRIAWLEMMTGNLDAGLATSREIIELVKSDASIELYVRLGRGSALVTLLSNLGSGAGEMRRYDIAQEALDEGIPLAVANDEDTSLAYMRAWKARIAFEQGRWSDSIEWAELAETTAPNRIGYAILTTRGALGRTRVRRGEEGGRQLLEDTRAVGVRHELQHVWPSWCGIAEHAWLWGKAESIPELIGHVYESALETDSRWGRGEIGFWMWMGGAIDGPPEGAAEPFALHMSGDWRGAAEAWREIGCPYEVALALSSGDMDAQFEALQIFDSLGARPAGAKLRGEMREAGIENIPRGPIRETQENPANLTPRQFEVLKLMIGGHSNAQIAEQLFVAKKTVEHHVSAIFSKLGVDSRSGAIEVGRALI